MGKVYVSDGGGWGCGGVGRKEGRGKEQVVR